jgi:hypothetical protein
VAKGFTQTYGLNYIETFSLVAKLSSICIIISLAANLDWPLHELDVKNALMHGYLIETVYMVQPPGFESKGECVISRNLSMASNNLHVLGLTNSVRQ